MNLAKKSIPEKAHSWKMFDEISSRYDFINRVLSFGNDLRWRKKLAQYLPDKENIHLLDVATGSADQILSLLKKTDRIEKAVGVDLSEKMLELAKSKAKKYPHVSFEIADANNLMFSENSFDCITCSFGIRNVCDVEKTLSEMYRVLKPNSRLMILEFSLPKKGLLKKFHLMYLRKILPFLGGVFSKNFQAYSYLNKTIETFPYGEAFCDLLKKERFKNIQLKTLSFGAVSIYIADK